MFNPGVFATLQDLGKIEKELHECKVRRTEPSGEGESISPRRPQYYRIRRVLDMVREGTQSGYLANSSDFKDELGVSRRTVARDMDFLRDEG